MIRAISAFCAAVLATSGLAEAPSRFAGDKRLECEYDKLEWKRMFVVGQFTESNTDPCLKLAWTEEGERLWKSYRLDLERHDRCSNGLWQRRLALAGGSGLLLLVSTFTVRQIRGDGGNGSMLAVAVISGAVAGGLFAWATERPCPALPVPEWAR